MDSLPKQTPSKTEVVEPERMSDDEVRQAGGPDPMPGAGTPPSGHFEQIFIKQTPDGTEFTRVSGDGGISSNFIMPKPPVWSTWICLFLAWVFLSSPIPFTIFLGLPLNIAALVLALVSLMRGGIGTGILVLALGTVGSVVVYLVGLLRFLSH